MKARKARLAALFLSAMMAVTYSAPYTYADEIVADDGAAAVEFAADAEDGPLFEDAGESENPAAETKETDPSGSKTGEAKITDVQFQYTGDDKGVATYKLGEKDQKVDATVYKKVAATCEEDGYVILQATIPGYEKQPAYSDPITTDEKGNKFDAAKHHKLNPTDKEETGWVESKRTVVTYPTHVTDGSAVVTRKCQICGKEETDVTITLPATGKHTYGPVQYEDFNNIKTEVKDGKEVPVLDAEGKAQLADSSKDGSYVQYWVCTDPYNDETDEQSKKTEKITIVSTLSTYAVVTATEEIASGVAVGDTFKPTTDNQQGGKLAIRANLPKTETIELENCEKAGRYQITYYNNDDKATGKEWIPVAAHHMLTRSIIEFNTAADYAAYKDYVKYNADGTYTVTNPSCYLPFDYQVVTHCTAAGCPEKKCSDQYVVYPDGVTSTADYHVISIKNETAQPAGEHIYDAKTRAKIEAAVKKATDEKKKLYYDDVKKIYEENVADKATVILGKDTSTCTEDGDITITFKCLVCKGAPETLTVHVNAKGHDWDDVPTVVKTIKEATCTEYGEYVSAIVCKRCGAEKPETEKTYKQPMIKHTNDLDRSDAGVSEHDVADKLNAKKVEVAFSGDKVIDYDGTIVKAFETNGSYGNAIKGNYIGGNDYYNDYQGAGKLYTGIEANAYSYCDVCGGNKTELTGRTSDIALKVLAVSKESKNGEAGSITVQATYTQQPATADKKAVTFTSTVTVPYFSNMAAYQARVEKTEKNGLVLEDGKFNYYKDDEIDKDFFGFVTYNGSQFLVANGSVATEANGLTLVNGKWYYLAQGQKTTFTGVTMYDGHFFYVTNGELDTNVDGLVQYQGGQFLFAAGMLQDQANGLWYNEFKKEWDFLANGMWQTSFSGVTFYDGAAFVVKAGVLDESLNGTYEYDGHTFYVAGGMLGDEVA